MSAAAIAAPSPARNDALKALIASGYGRNPHVITDNIDRLYPKVPGAVFRQIWRRTIGQARDWAQIPRKELAARANCETKAVDKALDTLDSDGLVITRKVGRNNEYSINLVRVMELDTIASPPLKKLPPKPKRQDEAVAKPNGKAAVVSIAPALPAYRVPAQKPETPPPVASPSGVLVVLPGRPPQPLEQVCPNAAHCELLRNLETIKAKTLKLASELNQQVTSRIVELQGDYSEHAAALKNLLINTIGEYTQTIPPQDELDSMVSGMLNRARRERMAVEELQRRFKLRCDVRLPHMKRVDWGIVGKFLDDIFPLWREQQNGKRGSPARAAPDSDVVELMKAWPKLPKDERDWWEQRHPAAVAWVKAKLRVQ